MTDPKSKADKEAGKLGETAKTHCIDVFASDKYGRRREVFNKFLEKGNVVEEDSITLLARHIKKMLVKNSEVLQNDFICGTPDTFLMDGANIEMVYDTKSMWDLHTFMKAKHGELDSQYYWQLQGYGWLTGAKKLAVAHCLVNSPPDIIDDEKRKIYYAFRGNEENPDYIAACKQIEKNHIYDMPLFLKHHQHYEFSNREWDSAWDIPSIERIHIFEFERNEADIKRIEQQVIKGRNFIETL